MTRDRTRPREGKARGKARGGPPGAPRGGSARRGTGGAHRGAREVALRVFLGWDASRETAGDLLRRHGESRVGGEARDRALAHELVSGVFRWRGRLDWQLRHVVSRPLEALDPAVLWILRLGLYQLEHLDRVPAHAAVDTSVELAKRTTSRGGASFVNAVLRKAPDVLAQTREPDASEDPLGHLESRTSHPRWLLERWLARFGFRKTLALAAANNRKPALTLRVVSDRLEAADLLADLRGRGVEAEPGALLPEAVRLPAGWHPAVREILEAGLCVVQDEASGLVAHLGRPSEGARILDVCAAPGGKGLHLVTLCGGSAELVAADASPRRLRRVREAAERVGIANVALVVADGRFPATRGGFSRVLVDAPCTNTGVLGRRPDARWRRGPEDLARLARLQGEILDAAREQVAPGGLLVYSTCSLEPEENEDVIRAYRERHPADAIAPAGEVLPDEVTRGDFLATDPTRLPLDGVFGAAIRPRAGAFPVIR